MTQNIGCDAKKLLTQMHWAYAFIPETSCGVLRAQSPQQFLYRRFVYYHAISIWYRIWIDVCFAI